MENVSSELIKEAWENAGLLPFNPHQIKRHCETAYSYGPLDAQGRAWNKSEDSFTKISIRNENKRALKKIRELLDVPGSTVDELYLALEQYARMILFFIRFYYLLLIYYIL
mgnify:CR=1 FL=1